ncbi:hypothetical protein [Cytobacillus oceanisediminis]|uniref:Biotin/lipoyl-binding protein n=1 Tax=Cytobacillus oceanisediminis TaxID=665099 RepID=A0A562K1B6_9BACI|nr:hypothetical protein [Cytobacillus oceanisediminis]TWH89005.1 hypothetical protein IQ19_01430 [Cytobacillus oceanisediminis]
MAVYFGVIISPCQGRVERVEITNESRIYEWDPLFYIKTPEGHVEVIQIGVSGEIESLEVQVGEAVIPGMVLAYIKEDLYVTGTD